MTEQRPDSKHLPQFMRAVWRSPISILGLIVTTTSAGLILMAIASDLVFGAIGAYQGLLVYMLLPAIFVGGLLLMPAGIYWQSRRARKRGQSLEELGSTVIDLGDPKQQRFVLFVALMTVINVAIIATVSYQGYHYTESVGFCGQLCHTVMQPEYVAYQRSPHARVACAECHIGSGASWFVKAKISGLRQVAAVFTSSYSRPIPTPIEDLRPARDTCEQCHWPQVFHGDKAKVFEHYVDDPERPGDPEINAVMLHIGGHDAHRGEYHGIHWHVSRDNKVEYRAADERRDKIREVRVVRADGTSVTYENKSIPPVPPETPWREMDCIDCHNRPTHIYESREGAVDRLLSARALDPNLPGMRAAALDVLAREYPSQEEARGGIAKALLAYFQEHAPEVAQARRPSLEAAAKTLFDQAYVVNVFPQMKISWDTYPVRLGHTKGVGCFRCHNEEHVAENGASISQDCELCHKLLAYEERLSEISEELRSTLSLPEVAAPTPAEPTASDTADGGTADASASADGGA